jgi:hypothetical protein
MIDPDKSIIPQSRPSRQEALFLRWGELLPGAWRNPFEADLSSAQDARTMPNDWTARIWAEFRCGNLTRAWRDALLTLATFRGRGGTICPSHATVAARTALAPKTVERALHAARDLGLVTWSERRVRRGWRWVRTSNLYRLILPDAPVEPGLRRPRRTNRPTVERGESKQERRITREMLVALPWEVSKAAQDGLAAIAAARVRTLGLGV